MNQRTKEVDGLRRLAELLRQAVTAAIPVVPLAKKALPRIEKLRRGENAIAPASTTPPRSRDDAP